MYKQCRGASDAETHVRDRPESETNTIRETSSSTEPRREGAGLPGGGREIFGERTHPARLNRRPYSFLCAPATRRACPKSASRLHAARPLSSSVGPPSPPRSQRRRCDLIVLIATPVPCSDSTKSAVAHAAPPLCLMEVPDVMTAVARVAARPPRGQRLLGQRTAERRSSRKRQRSSMRASMRLIFWMTSR